MKIRLKLVALCFLLLVFSFSCAKNDKESGNYVIASSFPSYTILRSIMGDDKDLKMLLHPGLEVHNYEPNPKTMIEIADASLLVYTGGESDEWIDTILESLDKPVPVFRLIDYVKLLPVDEGEDHQIEHHHEDEMDEHVWLSFENQIKLSRKLEKVLSKLNPSSSEEYRKNTDSYIKEIEKLKSEYSALVDNAKHNKVIFASRFPFRYLFDEFNLEYEAAFPGCNEKTEPSAKVVASLIESVRENELGYILNTEFSSESLPRVIAGETASEVLTLHSMHNIELARFYKGDDFISIMRENLEVLKKALN